MSKGGTKLITKSVRLSAEENAVLQRISAREFLPEGTLMRKLLLEGLARHRLEQAIGDYEMGDLNLGEAAQRAGVSVQRMMAELDRRGISLGTEEHVRSSLHTLAELFGASPELRQIIAERADS